MPKNQQLHSNIYTAHAGIPAYSCTNPHCYAQQDWYGPSGGYLTGSSTEVTVGHISCSSCNGVASVETWLVDDTSSQAFQCTYFICWIETGYAEKNIQTGCGPAGTECYFWGDNRPNGGLNYWPYALPSDNYGQLTQLFIENVDSSDWYISVAPQASSDGGFVGYSTSNTIYPQNIRVGSELGGTSGVSIPTQSFIQNEWSVNYNYYYQTNAGCESNQTDCRSDMPPTGYWNPAPSCCNAGGNYKVSIP